MDTPNLNESMHNMVAGLESSCNDIAEKLRDENKTYEERLTEAKKLIENLRENLRNVAAENFQLECSLREKYRNDGKTCLGCEIFHDKNRKMGEFPIDCNKCSRHSPDNWRPVRIKDGECLCVSCRKVVPIDKAFTLSDVAKRGVCFECY